MVIMRCNWHLIIVLYEKFILKNVKRLLSAMDMR